MKSISTTSRANLTKLTVLSLQVYLVGPNVRGGARMLFDSSTALSPLQHEILSAQARPRELVGNSVFIFLLALAQRRVLDDTTHGCRIANPTSEPHPEDKVKKHIEQCFERRAPSPVTPLEKEKANALTKSQQHNRNAKTPKLPFFYIGAL